MINFIKEQKEFQVDSSKYWNDSKEYINKSLSSRKCKQFYKIPKTIQNLKIQFTVGIVIVKKTQAEIEIELKNSQIL